MCTQGGIDRDENLVRCQLGFQAVTIDVVIGDNSTLRRISWLPGDQDNLYPPIAELVPDMVDQIEARLLGFHDHIKQYQCNVRMLAQVCHGFGGRPGVEQVQSALKDDGVLQGKAQHRMDVRFIVYQQYLPGADDVRVIGWCCFGSKEVVEVFAHERATKGRSRWKRAPCPGTLSHWMRPPSRWVTRL